ncbi:hypothetical protein [Spiroplasma endosymbiont of Apeira syringaria]|uniref:hypothetical protein n=1 Tax=Spiroplasma endosymbiont of Apeira syringaria TaxID=3066307 RepID=UPI0030CB9E02
MQDIAVQFEKHCWIHSVSLFPPQVHVGRSPYIIYTRNIYLRSKIPTRSITNINIILSFFNWKYLSLSQLNIKLAVTTWNC